jgi:hypothetical protein
MSPYTDLDTILSDLAALAAQQDAKDDARREILAACDAVGASREPTSLREALAQLDGYANLRAAVCEFLHADADADASALRRAS